MNEPRRKRGRPPLAEGEATVRLPIVWVPESLRVALRDLAAALRVPEGEVVREALRRELRRQRAAVDAARRRLG